MVEIYRDNFQNYKRYNIPICNRLLKKEPKEKGQAPCMIVFCAFEQLQTVKEYGEKYGFEIDKTFYEKAKNEMLAETKQIAII